MLTLTYLESASKHFLNENMKVRDLLFLGMGFDDLKFKDEIYLKRADLFRKINKFSNKIIINRFNLESVLDTTNEESFNYHLISVIKTNKFLDKIYKIRDRVDVLLNNDDYSIVKVLKKLNQNGKKTN